MEADTNVNKCFLCEKGRTGVDDENYILHREASSYILLNEYPYNTGHLLVSPYVHTGNIEELDQKTGVELWSLQKQAVEVLSLVYGPDGFNIGMNLGASAGAALIDHLHIHIVPRWAGDTNYMSVLNNTKVLSEMLKDTFNRLKPHFSVNQYNSSTE